MRKPFYIAIGLSLFLVACFTTVPAVSSTDKGYFTDLPEIVTYATRYFLRWRYAENAHYYMFAQYELKGQKLQFFIGPTSSTADAAGKLHFQEIKGLEEKLKIKLGKAFWREPNGNLTSLSLSPLDENEIEHVVSLK